MMLKVFAVLAVIFLIEGSQASIIIGISKATRARLERAINETIEDKRQSAVEVDAIRNLIQRRIEAALSPIEKELKTLKCTVKKAEKNAKASGADIKECVQKDKKAVHEINKEVALQCRDTIETISAGEKLGEIQGLINALREAPNNCANKGLLANTCVITIIDSSRQRALVKQNEISVILRHTDPDERDECILEGVKQLREEVDKISDDWYECLQRHEGVTAKEA